METIQDELLRLTYIPAINVYLVWILGIYFVRWIHKTTQRPVSELPEKDRKHWELYINKDGEWNKPRIRFFQLILIPLIALGHDYLMIFIGGSPLVVYRRLWWAQFLPLSTILELSACC